jgi:hypothetical protein
MLHTDKIWHQKLTTLKAYSQNSFHFAECTYSKHVEGKLGPRLVGRYFFAYIKNGEDRPLLFEPC